ncbi:MULTISPECIES: thioredoxin [unclassified Oscillibacter]|uniref:thioredoxin n=1 Tax=unclassified Oscillibacter TaxID=2629304 RepID=UPI0025D592E6|nr:MULTISPECIES: thioredoxin [unclassified Oscillibacter]
MALVHLNNTEFDATIEAAPLAMVDFWADWCGPCKMVGPTVEKIAADYDGRALVAKVNIDQEPELAQRFGVMSIPTLVFLKNGEEFDRKVGVMPEAAFTAVLDESL